MSHETKFPKHGEKSFKKDFYQEFQGDKQPTSDASQAIANAALEAKKKTEAFFKNSAEQFGQQTAQAQANLFEFVKENPFKSVFFGFLTGVISFYFFRKD